MDLEKLKYKIAFASISGMGCDLAKKFLDVISTEEDFFQMPQSQLEAITGSKSKIISDSYRAAQLDKAKAEVDFIQSNNIKATYFTDSDYPTRLLNAPDAPIILFSLGECNLNSKHIISIVGTRNSTAYGNHFCEKLIEELSQSINDLIVVSGLAYGIDITSHRACLKYNVPTIAVLAHGLNTIYPSSHRNYAIDIVKNNGMLLTDYSSQDVIHKGNFIARNRIIAALSDCTIVVESADKGGALATARLASSYNREVFALPGKISDEYSIGCNHLIQKNAANMITCTEDLLSAMQWNITNKKPRQKELFPDISEEENSIIVALKKNGELHINSITSIVKMPVHQVMTLLIELEFKGLILALPGCRYSIA